MKHILRPVLAGAAVLVVVAGCTGASGGAAETSGGPATTTTTATASPSPTVPPASARPPGADEGGEPEVAFPADTSADESEASGGPLSIVAVRAAAQDGYERVVLEMGGDAPGEPGWRASYVAAPSQQGSGSPVDVAGQAFLQVVVTGSGYPFDTGAQEYTGTLDPDGTEVVAQVVAGGVFEGQSQVFVGLSDELPFRVFRLADPPRVVVDVRTDG